MLFDPKYRASFSSLPSNAHEYNIIGFDTEDNSAGEVISFAFYDGGKHTGKDKFYYTTDNKDAVRFILEYPETSMFVAHNLEYDLNNVFKADDFKYINEQIKTPKLVKATLLGSKNFFYNSNAFFFSSLRKMGDVVGLPKLEGEEQDRFNPNYVVRDAEICYTYMMRLQKSIIDNYQMRMRATVGALSMGVFRTHFMKSKKQTTFNNPELLKAYYGGRTEIFYKGIIAGKIKIPDINSSYPHVMYKYKFPDTSTLCKSSIHTHTYGVGKFKVRVPKNTFIPVLPHRSPEGKLFFPVGTFTGYWTYNEMNEAIKHGVKIIKEYDGVGTNKGIRPFKEFVDNFYTERRECKKDIKKFEKKKKLLKREQLDLLSNLMRSEELKYILNNLYGKFAQHRSNAILIRRPLSQLELESRMKGEWKESRLGPFYQYKSKTDNAAMTANYLWAIYVTSYARIEMHRHLMTIHKAGGILLYGDTDSIMFAGEIDDSVLDIGSGLGQLEYERAKDGSDVFDLALFRQAKGYLICNLTGTRLRQKGLRRGDFLKEAKIMKVACKGVPTDYAYDFILCNMAAFERPMKQNEYFISCAASKSQRKQILGINVWDEVEKRMNLEYIKRMGEGVTKPVNAKDIEAIEQNVRGALVPAYEEKIKEFGYAIIRKRPTNVFTKVKIPKGWIKSYPWEPGEEKRLSSKSKILLRAIHYRNLPEDTVWFAGYVTGIYTGGNHDKSRREFLELRLTQFEGDILDFCSLYARINIKVFNKLNLLKKLNNVKDMLLTVTKIDDEEVKIEAIKDDKLIDFKKLKNLKAVEEKNKLRDYLRRKGKLPLNF